MAFGAISTLISFILFVINEVNAITDIKVGAYKGVQNMYTSTLSYVQYYYTRLQIRKALVFAIIPNIVDIQF